MGVAPKAKILPVRVFGLNGSFTSVAFIEAIGYAADRGADVINLSFRSTLNTTEEEKQIARILKRYPKLVIVAAAGNESNSEVTSPAGYDGVIAVGATNIRGNRTSYSNYGKGLSVVAPGGDFNTLVITGGDVNTLGFIGGIPATGGTWLEDFWQGIGTPTSPWSSGLDPKGKYWWVQGTSFASPAVAGVVALMKGENPEMSREDLVKILKSTANYQGLTVSDEDTQLYNSALKECKEAKSDSSESEPEKCKVLNDIHDPNQYFFGSGLVNADAAVQAVKKGQFETLR